MSRERMQDEPDYAELCRRYLSDRQDFSEEKLAEAGIDRRYENLDLDKCCLEIVRQSLWQTNRFTEIKIYDQSVDEIERKYLFFSDKLTLIDEFYVL